MFTRYASAVTSGILVTFVLLFLMQLLIALQPGAAVEARVRHNLDVFKRKIINSPIQTLNQLPLRQQLTKMIMQPPRSRTTSSRETIRVPMNDPAPPNTTGLPSLGVFTDGPLVAMVRVAPIYPARAAARGIEGFVVVQFDVAADGTVTNIAVLESTHAIFDSAAIQAAQKFRFKPQVIDGVALPSLGIQNIFRFRLDDQ